jgi:hypothetical protein
MSRSVSANFRSAVYSQSTDEVPVLLVTMEHDNLTEAIRVSTDNADQFDVDGEITRGTISNGENFIFYPMAITLPDDSEESVTSASLTIDNIDRTIMREIRQLTDSPTITMQVVLASSPDTIEAEFDSFKFDSISADALTITGQLSLEHFYREPFPGTSMLPSNFPGMF